MTQIHASAAGVSPRIVTTGGKISPSETHHLATPERSEAEAERRTGAACTEGLAHIDWLAFTITPPDGFGLDWLWPSLRDLFAIPSMQEVDRVGKWNGYTTVFDLGGHGLLGIGGETQNGTIHISLTGSGCAHVSDWQAVQDWMQVLKVRITRADLAHDDFYGKTLNIETAVHWYHEGQFKTGGRNPAHRVEGDWLDPGSPKGRTLYIGRKANGKLACIYEKGKQLGDPSSPWTRAEVRLGGKSRMIPLDVLTRPGDYLAGAYPCLAFLSAVQEKIRTISKVVSMSLASVIHHTRQTGGKVVNLLRTLYAGDDSKVVEALARPGFPKRLAGYGDFLPLATAPEAAT